MHIILVGANHKSAPVEVRERLAFRESELPGALEALGKVPFVHERVILSTCNRVEVYATTDEVQQGLRNLVRFICDAHGANASELESCFYCYAEPQSVHHAFSVASSLDSMVVGEAEIVAQVKGAYRRAWENGATGKVLNQLFQQALRVAKSVRTLTDIARRPVSVSSVAVELAEKIFGDLEGKATLIVGAGKMSEAAAGYLARGGAQTVMVANRTFARAEELASRFGGKAIKFEEFREALGTCDIVISSTGAPHFILRKDDIVLAMARRRNRPLFIIDIAVPRDVEPAAERIDNVYLYNIDDLKKVADANLREREREVEKSRGIIQSGTGEFMTWLSSLEVVPTIEQLKRKFEGIVHRELTRALAGSRPGAPRSQEEVAWLTQLITRKLLARPIAQLKKEATRGNGTMYTSALQELFELWEVREEETREPGDKEASPSSGAE